MQPLNKVLLSFTDVLVLGRKCFSGLQSHWSTSNKKWVNSEHSLLWRTHLYTFLLAFVTVFISSSFTVLITYSNLLHKIGKRGRKEGRKGGREGGRKGGRKERKKEGRMEGRKRKEGRQALLFPRTLSLSWWRHAQKSRWPLSRQWGEC